MPDDWRKHYERAVNAVITGDYERANVELEQSYACLDQRDESLEREQHKRNMARELALKVAENAHDVATAGPAHWTTTDDDLNFCRWYVHFVRRSRLGFKQCGGDLGYSIRNWMSHIGSERYSSGLDDEGKDICLEALGPWPNDAAHVHIRAIENYAVMVRKPETRLEHLSRIRQVLFAHRLAAIDFWSYQDVADLAEHHALMGLIEEAIDLYEYTHELAERFNSSVVDDFQIRLTRFEPPAFKQQTLSIYERILQENDVRITKIKLRTMELRELDEVTN